MMNMEEIKNFAYNMFPIHVLERIVELKTRHNNFLLNKLNSFLEINGRRNPSMDKEKIERG